MTTGDLFGERRSGAEFSICRVYRYRLWRQWGDGPALNCIGLNPSTADEIANDPTITRMERRAREWGFDSLVMTNLFALRSADPRALPLATDPIGPANDEHLHTVALASAMVLCAWGNGGSLAGRGRAVTKMLRDAGVALYALRVGKSGSPLHPLYLSYSLRPVIWTPSALYRAEEVSNR